MSLFNNTFGTVGTVTKTASTWSLATSGIAENIHTVAYANSSFVATTNASVRSTDGISWSLTGQLNPAAVAGFYGLAYGAGVWVVGTNGGTSTARIFTSTDNGATWVGRSSPFVSGDYINTIAYGNGIFVAYGGNSTWKLATSTDGLSWSNRTVPASISGRAYVSFINGKFFMIDSSGTCYSSSNGTTWTSVTVGMASQSVMAYGNGTYVALGYTTSYGVATSTDGVTWTTRTSALTSAGFATNVQMKCITYAEGLFVAVGYSGSVATSVDGVTWVKKTSPNFGTLQFYGVCNANGKFVVTGQSGKILYSLD